MQDRTRTPGEDIARRALIVFGVTAAVVTLIAVIESYSNLLAFGNDHGLAGWPVQGAMAPLAVDSFIIMGELLLFASILLRWGMVPHALGAGMAAWGFALSVGGNVWHAPSATLVDRAVAAIWPVTATAGLAGALIIVRQLMKTPGEAAHPPGRSTGTGLPPDPDREEPRRVRPSRAAKRPPGPAADIDEQALLADLLKRGTPLPSFRSWSFEQTGMHRSAPAKRAYIQAQEQLKQLNGAGSGHGDGRA